MDSKNLPAVSIVIAAHNEEKHIYESIKAVDKMDYPRDLIEVIMVDSNSKDKTWDIGSKIADKCVRIKSKYPSAGESFNAGILASSHDYVWISGGDIVLDAQFLKIAINALKKNEKVAVVSGYWLEMEKKGFNKILDNMDLISRKNEDSYIDTPNGGVFRKNALVEVNGYDERIKKGQETEIGIRLRNNGWLILRKNYSQGIHDYDTIGCREMARRYMVQGESAGRLILSPYEPLSKDFFKSMKKNSIKALIYYTVLLGFGLFMLYKSVFVEFLLLLILVYGFFYLKNVLKTKRRGLGNDYLAYLNGSTFFSIFSYFGIIKIITIATLNGSLLNIFRGNKKGLNGFDFSVIMPNECTDKFNGNSSANKVIR